MRQQLTFAVQCKIGASAVLGVKTAPAVSYCVFLFYFEIKVLRVILGEHHNNLSVEGQKKNNNKKSDKTPPNLSYVPLDDN